MGTLICPRIVQRVPPNETLQVTAAHHVFLCFFAQPGPRHLSLFIRQLAKVTLTEGPRASHVDISQHPAVRITHILGVEPIIVTRKSPQIVQPKFGSPPPIVYFTIYRSLTEVELDRRFPSTWSLRGQKCGPFSKVRWMLQKTYEDLASLSFCVRCSSSHTSLIMTLVQAGGL